MSDDLERIQIDTMEALLAVPSLALAHVMRDDEGDIESRIERVLATGRDDSGKRGLAVIVLPVRVVETERNLPGPPLRVKVEVQIIEEATANRGSRGTGIRSEVAALRVLGALHHHQSGGHLLYADKDPVSPVPVKPGFVSHGVTLFARIDALDAPARPDPVSAEIDGGGALELTCATAGADIWWTSDGSYPRPDGGTSQLYADPIPGLVAGTKIRAAAYAEGMNPGDVLNLTITE